MSDPFETLKIFREPDGQYRIEANDGVLSIPASSIREAMGLATGYLESVDAAYRELMSNIEAKR